MSAVEVRDRLAERFRLLKGSQPGPERQLTLRHAVEWSYDLLTEDERNLLRLTSVFAGGFDLTSVCAVVDGADDVEVLRHARLVGPKVARDRRLHGHAHPVQPLRDHPPVRRGPAWRRRARSSRLVTGTPSTSPGRRAARWEHWNGPGWREAVDWVEAELGNLRSGYRWSAGAWATWRSRPTSPRTPRSMGFSVQLFETLAWAEELLEPAAARRRPPASPPLHGRRLRLLRRQG